jgi:hypothetical protein
MKLFIPMAYEEMSAELKYDISKLTQIVQPVIEVEKEINVILTRVRKSGNVLFLLGKSGVGKSTFLDSLKWRSHIVKRNIINLNSTEIVPSDGLNGLFRKIKEISDVARVEADKGPTIIVIDYLESIADQQEIDISGFFRNLNGLIRISPILIIWPVTRKEDADFMIDLANRIATTLFYPGKEIINFSGPEEDMFIDIGKRTITVINDGKEPSEFGITNDTFCEVLNEFKALPHVQKTIRTFLHLVKCKWELQSDYLKQISAKIPRPIEVWFCFAYKNAESVVSQFSRKGQTVEETWTPIHDKFFEYIPNSQRSSVWNATRLQLALFGYIKTRIMFLPTNALIATLLAYSDNNEIQRLIKSHNPPKYWNGKRLAQNFLSSTPLVKQARGEKYQIGLRKGGPAAKALELAAPIFSSLNKGMTCKNISDVAINKPIAEALTDLLGFKVFAQTKHPWLKNICPDILLDLPDKTISVEFHYTDDDSPHKIADYVLKKLNTYMSQIEEKSE